MKIKQLVTIELDSKERDLLVAFIERNQECDSNFDESESINKEANSFARTLVLTIQ